MYVMVCPFNNICPSGIVTPGQCPSFMGTSDIDGIPLVYCKSSKLGYTVACPNCGEIASFSLTSETPFHNWLCKRCSFYQIPDEIARATHLPKTGLAKKVTNCECGNISWAIAPPVPNLSEVQWRCPHCRAVRALSDVI